VHMVDIVRTVAETSQILTEELRRPPTRQEIAELSGLDLERVNAALDAPGDTVSLDRPIGEEGDTVLQDFIEDNSAADPFNHAAEVMRRSHIDRALEILDTDEKRVVILRYGLDGADARTLSEVGTFFDLTRERIRQIEGRALAKLRHPSCAVELEDLI